MTERNFNLKKNLINTETKNQAHTTALKTLQHNYFKLSFLDDTVISETGILSPFISFHCSEEMQMQKFSKLVSLLIEQKQLSCLCKKPIKMLLVSSFFCMCVSERQTWTNTYFLCIYGKHLLNIRLGQDTRYHLEKHTVVSFLHLLHFCSGPYLTMTNYIAP